MRQNSYVKTNKGNLYLVPTPIGNLDDITLRAINTFKEVDIVFAEDTRVTMSLLKHLNINKKVESCHKFSEAKNKDKIIRILSEGKNIAYSTDRGTPLISDPGNVIVEEVIKKGYNVIALPGASALLPAINMSGLSNEKFYFYGFLDSKKSKAKKELVELKNFNHTLIFYEAPHRIKETLNIMLEVFGDRKIAIAREITKLYEEIIRDNISNIIDVCDSLKGEIVIVVSGNYSIEFDYDIDSCVKEVKDLIKNGYTKKDAIKEICDKYNVKKNKLYNLIK